MPAQNRIIDIKKTDTGSEPITLAQVKAQLIISFTDDDTLLTSLITQARKAIENYCAVSIVTKNIILTADLFQEWELPWGPVTGITGVAQRSGTQGSGPATYATAADWTQSGDEFISFAPGSPAGWDWGAPLPKNFSAENRYRITYNTGPYTPEDLLLAILNEVAYRYENRGNETATKGLITGICEAAQALAFPYKRLLWF